MYIKKLICILLVSFFSVHIAAAANVSISGNSFQPATINITSGHTVTWTNLDPVQHTVTDDAGFFDSGLLSTGHNFAFTFITPGNFNYHCTIHPFMTGTVVVSEQISPVLTAINVTPLMITLASGSTKTFTAKGFDRDNNEINISLQVNWTVSNTSVGAIIPININSGMFTALAAGTTTITAVLDNISATATAIVTADLSPEVAEYDLNHDGHIQKNEAIVAVVDYFADRIPKSVAIEVILAYFNDE